MWPVELANESHGAGERTESHSAVSGTPLHHNTDLSLTTCAYSLKICSIQCCLFQRVAVRNTSMSFCSSNLQQLQHHYIFPHLRTCSGPVFRYFHHIILLFELPDSLLPTLLYWKWCFNNAICLHAGLLLVSPAGKQVYAGMGAHVEGMGAHVEQKILSS